MTLYLVHGNTWFEGYGYVANIFGVYTKKDTAEAVRNRVRKELYKKGAQNKQSLVEDISDIEVDVLEITADEAVNIELGGYCE